MRRSIFVQRRGRPTLTESLKFGFSFPSAGIPQLSARIPSAKSYCASGTHLLHFPAATPSRYELNMSAIAPA